MSRKPKANKPNARKPKAKATAHQPKADSVHLIVAKDAEVTIEYYPEDWLAIILFWSLAFIVFLQFFTRFSTTVWPGPKRSRAMA
jgi:hypothetical protein